MQVQAERKEKKKAGIFKWTRNLGIMPSFRTAGVVKINERGDGDVEYEKQTPMDMRTRLVRARATPKWRNSLS